MQQAPAWFKEVIKDKINILYQAKGGFLDGTMVTGDTQANTVKFPIIGRLEAHEITGSIQPVQASNADMSTVQVSMKDFEASAWISTKDKYKMGPADVGSATTVIDILPLEEARASIAASGPMDDDEFFCPMPEHLYAQLLMYKEFSNARYVGAENAPFSKPMRGTARTMRGVHYFTMPDEYFFDVTGARPASVDIYMWAKSAMGAETPWNKEAPRFTEHPDREGTPLLGKVGMGGAAIGIVKEGVKKLTFKNATTLERPVVRTTVV